MSVGLGFRRARLQHVYSILRGKDLETGEYSDERRVQQFAVLKEAQDHILNLQCWHEFLKTLMRAGYRRGEMITSEMTLVYTYTLFLIEKRDFRVGLYVTEPACAVVFHDPPDWPLHELSGDDHGTGSGPSPRR